MTRVSVSGSDWVSFMISSKTISVVVSTAAEDVFGVSKVVVAVIVGARSVMVMSEFFMFASEAISVVVSTAVEVVFGMVVIVVAAAAGAASVIICGCGGGSAETSMVSEPGVSWLYKLDG